MHIADAFKITNAGNEVCIDDGKGIVARKMEKCIVKCSGGNFNRYGLHVPSLDSVVDETQVERFGKNK